MDDFQDAGDFKLNNKVRIVTATSLFDGHDAAIHIMRRILQSEGAEVIHLGHNRSAEDVVRAAVQEDAQGIAVSSYQGGHVEYFTYLLELLKEHKSSHIKIFGGGGGVISKDEIELLEKRGVSKIFSPEDGQRLGLVGMIRHILKCCDYSHKFINSEDLPLAQKISFIEQGGRVSRRSNKSVPVIGITGPGGAGKSSLTDELLLRFLDYFPEKKFAVLSVDPSRKRTGGALLGDRIRMNCAADERVFMRSMATRQAHKATSSAVEATLEVMQDYDFDLVILETAGIGQSGTEVCELADVSMYVMTAEFGAPSQLEKIDMLDYADLIALNKFDRQGSLDALRDIQKTYQRNRRLFNLKLEDMPVYGTCAHLFNDCGVNSFFRALLDKLADFASFWQSDINITGMKARKLIPDERAHYLSDIATVIGRYHQEVDDHRQTVSRLQSLFGAISSLQDKELMPFKLLDVNDDDDSSMKDLIKAYNALLKKMPIKVKEGLLDYEHKCGAYERENFTYNVRQKQISVANFSESLSHLQVPKVSMPRLQSWGDQISFLLLENTAGTFPFTNGVFPFKRKDEDPTRMFAGEGHAEQTNRRFHFVSEGHGASRLSTAFDSVTLYGEDPAVRPDIFGKIGNAGVSICSLDDAKRLYSGFNLCAPSTSVSMTINGPAPIILAFYMNAAIDAECERVLKNDGRWKAVERKIKAFFKKAQVKPPEYRQDLPAGHDSTGLGFLGVSADRFMDKEEYEAIKERVLKAVRGTVQADILKEDQAQNTCIFSTQFALRMMGDVQEYFIEHDIRNFYSVSISGYHIAEAGATPVTQLAFTLANGFTILEYYLARGMKIDDFAHNLSFFFSNGMDPEYAVIGRVARRIWSIVIANLYGGNERSQKLKYHIQTSGRSLHAQEMEFNDIRTTLQALYALADNCNSLHTNAFDEALTTPTEKSVRRAIAIQMIINNECGLLASENPLQGSFFIEKMTDMVEEAVLKEFRALNARGGVVGAMETMYQRSKIQEESMAYEHLKHSGELKIVGVNFWRSPNEESEQTGQELRRSTKKCKTAQVRQVKYLHRLYKGESLARLQMLKDCVAANGNTFEALMEVVKVCTLGQVTHCLFEAGGAYRRNM